MTDWLPVVGIGLAGTLTTLGLLLSGLQSGAASRLVAARRAFWVTVVATALVYALYLVFGESWLWYE